MQMYCLYIKNQILIELYILQTSQNQISFKSHSNIAGIIKISVKKIRYRVQKNPHQKISASNSSPLQKYQNKASFLRKILNNHIYQ